MLNLFNTTSLLLGLPLELQTKILELLPIGKLLYIYHQSGIAREIIRDGIILTDDDHSSNIRAISSASPEFQLLIDISRKDPDFSFRSLSLRLPSTVMPLEVWNILARTSNITVTSTTLKTNSNLLPAMKNATINLIVDQANGFEEILTLPNIANVAFDINSSPEDSIDTSVFGCNGIYQLQTEMFPLTEEHDVFRHVHSIAFCGTDSEDYKYVELIPKLTNLKSFKWKGLIQDPDILGLMLKLLPEDLKQATLEDVMFDNVNLREVCASSVKLVHCSFQMLASHDFAKNGFFNRHITALELVDCKFNLHRITLPYSLKALHIEYNRPAAYRFDLASMKSLEELSWDNYSITLPDSSLPSSLLHLKCNISSLEYIFPKNLITLDVDLQTAKKLHRLSFPECLRHLAIKARSSALNGTDTNLVALHKLESFVFENKDSAAGSLRVPCQFTGPSTTPQIILTT